MKTELMKHNWDFTLYDTDGIKTLNVAFYNSYFDFSREFKLQDEELDYDFDELKALAEDIRNHYENYKDREIPE